MPFIHVKCTLRWFLVDSWSFTSFQWALMHACNGCSLGKWILDVSFCRITNMCSPDAIATFSKAGYKWVAKNCIVFSLRLGVPLSCVTWLSVSPFLLMFILYTEMSFLSLKTAPLPPSQVLGCASSPDMHLPVLCSCCSAQHKPDI